MVAEYSAAGATAFHSIWQPAFAPPAALLDHTANEIFPFRRTVKWIGTFARRRRRRCCVEQLQAIRYQPDAGHRSSGQQHAPMRQYANAYPRPANAMAVTAMPMMQPQSIISPMHARRRQGLCAIHSAMWCRANGSLHLHRPCRRSVSPIAGLRSKAMMMIDRRNRSNANRPVTTQSARHGGCVSIWVSTCAKGPAITAGPPSSFTERRITSSSDAR